MIYPPPKQLPEGGFGIAELALHIRQTHLKLEIVEEKVFIQFCMEVEGFQVLCNATDSWKQSIALWGVCLL